MLLEQWCKPITCAIVDMCYLQKLSKVSHHCYRQFPNSFSFLYLCLYMQTDMSDKGMVLHSTASGIFHLGNKRIFPLCSYLCKRRVGNALRWDKWENKENWRQTSVVCNLVLSLSLLLACSFSLWAVFSILQKVLFSLKLIFYLYMVSHYLSWVGWVKSFLAAKNQENSDYSFSGAEVGGLETSSYSPEPQ